MKFYIACIQKLSELVQDSIDTERHRFMACPSLRVFEANDFEFLTDNQLNATRALQHEDISMQLNSMSSMDTSWDIDANNNLFDHYKEHLRTLKIKDEETVSDEVGSGLGLLYDDQGAPTSQVIKYSKMLETYTELLEQKDSLQKKITIADTQESKDLALKKLEVLQRKITLHLANWKHNGSKELIEAALDKENKLSDYDTFLELKSKVESELLNSELTGIQSHSSFTKLQIIPSNFYKDSTAWSSLEIMDNEVDAIFEDAKKATIGLNEDLFDFEYEDTFIKKITINYCLIDIKRAWLKKNLIDSEFIINDGVRKSARYAKKIVLLKDIRVILHDNLDEKEKKIIEAKSILKFGPIFMKNQFFTNQFSKESFIKPITNKVIYTNKFAHKIDKKLILAKPKMMIASPMIKPKIANTRAVSDRRKRPVPIPQKGPKKPIPKNKNAMVIANRLPLTIVPSLMFHSVNWANTSKQSRLHVTVTDKILKTGIYDVEILIKSTNSNYFKEVQTNHEGTISLQLPKGNYRIEMRKNGYKEIIVTQVVQENKNIELKKTLKPEEVVYDSFFLGGIIGEQVTF